MRYVHMKFKSSFKVTGFLKTATLPNSGADSLGRRFAAELVLALAAQRGSLRYLLEWIEMALCAAAACQADTPSGGENSNQVATITYEFFTFILRQMKRSSVSFDKKL